MGIATVFRHFPRKQDLLEAMVLARLEHLLGKARALVASGEADGFFCLFAEFVEEAGRKRDFGDVLTQGSETFRSRNALLVEELWVLYGVLIERGQAAGLIRPDFDAGDLRALLVGVNHSLRVIGSDPQRRQRLLEVLEDGIRPPQG